jgi:hypothetical protein|tara:strand:- start:1556 stop:2152 length:597 start_codon:yes stop_codon:yes gene_type:complete
MAGYGLRPYMGKAFGQAYNTGGFTEYPIDVSVVTYDCYTGDFMTLTSTGEVTRTNGTAGATPVAATFTIGVAVGFRYVDPDGDIKWSQKYVGNANNTEAYAFIVSDPDAAFIVQADGAVTQASVGARAPVVNFIGSAASSLTGNSGMQLDASEIATTATFALQIIGIPQDGSNETSTTPNIVVRLTPGVHQANIALGV